MLKLFNRNTVVQVLFIMAALGLLWGPSLITPPPMSAVEGGGVLYILTTMWLSRVPLLAVVLAVPQATRMASTPCERRKAASCLAYLMMVAAERVP